MSVRFARRTIAALAAVLTALAGAATLSASNGGGDQCHPSYNRVFEAWNDDSQYVLMPSGALESSSGWSLQGGAGIVAGNEPFYVNSGGDRHSLYLPSASSATSPTLCTSLFRPKLRMFAVNSGAADATLKVEARTEVLGVRRTETIGYLTAGGTWQPTPRLSFLTSLTQDTIGTVSFRFTPIGTGSSWRIDDVYVDYPFHER